MVRRSGQRGVPVTTVGDEVIVGFDRPRLERVVAGLNGRTAKPPDGRPRFGAAVADAPAILRRQGQPPIDGAYVGSVRPDTPAAHAGLQPGDIITQVDRRPIATAAELERAVERAGAGQPLDLTVIRNGQPRHLRAYR
jgi:S1-C subfamily serine protease